MNLQLLKESLVPFVKRNYILLTLGLLGLIFFSYGLMSLLAGSKSEAGDIIFEAGKDSSTLEAASSSAASVKTPDLVIDIEGAVVSPEVYHLPLGSRIKDALIAAKGLSSDADRSWITKNLNLAAKLTDGAKIYIPKINDNLPNLSTVAKNSGSININTASEKELDGLPGIGPVTAEKIIGLRPYSEINDLLTKKAVSSKVFEQIKEKITAY